MGRSERRTMVDETAPTSFCRLNCSITLRISLPLLRASFQVLMCRESRWWYTARIVQPRPVAAMASASFWSHGSWCLHAQYSGDGVPIPGITNMLRRDVNMDGKASRTFEYVLRISRAVTSFVVAYMFQRSFCVCARHCEMVKKGLLCTTIKAN